ncbi:conserved hypothetical protein [Staphylococcus aureus subsp. aureus C160]|nr:conserved hypothetical protein [Staphylococcus aureus subsp. aureus WW2703/97]EFC01629.1 conserved hypothetical protein [Staphylococcus aureus subsp. aureus C160]EFC27504.1 conserved hypothetical protein [Staphylococcus aureus subsp. aureus A017934/97]MBG1182135.1 hypothetical protein [Staphylococcus aureus]
MTERKCACNKLFSTLVRGPNKENFEKKFYRQCELGCGSQQREIGFPISTDNASWRGPNKEKLDSQFLQTMQVGVGQRNKFCKNIISVPLPRFMLG